MYSYKLLKNNQLTVICSKNYILYALVHPLFAVYPVYSTF